MAKIKREQEVSVTHTNLNGRQIPDGGKSERLVKGQARWSLSGRRIDGNKKEDKE